MTNEILFLKRHFDQKHLHVSEYYLQCCLEWIHTQFTSSSEAELCEKVYEQWLLADLREIGVSCLPKDLSKQKKTVLQGNYAVQVMYFKDISRSSLSQLKNIRNMYKLTRGDIDKENEPQGKRTLYLQLTDGVENIYAFEYETVKCLDINMTPGIKIFLTGPLNIRNGEILLKNNNVKILGGEVEDILVTNHFENVLARELNLPENPNPGLVETENVANEIRNKQTNQINGNINQERIVQNQNIRPAVQQQNAVFNVNPSTSGPQQHLNENIAFNVADNFADDDDAFMAQISVDYEPSNKNEARIEIDEMDFVDDLTDFDIAEQLNEIEEHAREINNQNRIEFPVEVSGEPYNYIKQLIDNRSNINDQIFRVKAQFVGVVEKLTFSKLKGWTMKFKITDGTAVIVVDFLSKVLEKLLGVSHEQALVLKHKVANKVIGASERIKELLYECKEKLTLLNCFMGLKYFGNNEIPTVVWLEPVLPQHFNRLKERVDRVTDNF